MTDDTTTHQWPRRPSLTTTRLLSLTLALLCTLAGWLLVVFADGMFWFLGLFLLSIWVLLKGGPWVVRALESAGLFGRVTLDGRTLRAGRHRLALDDPFRLSIQHNQVDASYEIRLDQMGVSSTRQKRTESRFVTLLQGRAEQVGTRLHFVADVASTSGYASIDLHGLSYHRTPVGVPDGPVIRMRPDDLADLLRVLGQTPASTVVEPPETQPAGRDPRTRFWPTWKTVVGAVALVALAVGVGLWSMELRPARPLTTPSNPSAETPDAPEPQEPTDPRAEALVGTRVHVWGEEGVQLYGTVESYRLEAREADAEPPRTLLSIRLDAMQDPLLEPLPADARGPYGPGGVEVGVGSVIEVDPEVTLVGPADADD